MDRIAITGTGRSGTTFLMRLLSLLSFDTGYSQEEILNNVHVSSTANAGLEKFTIKNPMPKIVKDPRFIKRLNFNTYEVKEVILVVRDYTESAKSRYRIKQKSSMRKPPGGLWDAESVDEQIQVYYNYIANFIKYAAEEEIKLHLISFEKMISDREYLKNKIEYIFNTKIDNNIFIDAYRVATNLSKPKK